MRRLVAIAAALSGSVGFLVPVSEAGAYSAPSGLNESTYANLCPVREPDSIMTGSNATPVAIDGSFTVANNATGYATGTVNAGVGPAELSISSGLGKGTNYFLQVQASDGSWHTVYQQAVGVTTPPTYNVNASIGSIPPGPVRVGLTNGEGASDNFVVELTTGYATVGDIWSWQQATDMCISRAQGDAQRHTDLQGIDTDTTAVKSAVNALTANGATLDSVRSAINGLTANGTTLDTLGAKLTVLDGDVKQLDADMVAKPTGGTPNGTMVQLSSADRQLSADMGNQLDKTLWVAIGALLGLFAMYEVLRFWRGRDS